MSIRALKEEEDGAVMVLVAISMTVLLGFAALAVDFGQMAARKQYMQNAADAAALAVAQDLGDGKPEAVQHETLNTYCSVNGFDPADADISAKMTVTDKTVHVVLSESLEMGFSSVLTGKHRRTISAEATAKAISIFGDCPYAMFAGQKIEDDGTGILISGNDITINGNIHSNSDITMRHAVLSEGAVATAVRNIQPSTKGWNANSIALDMPSFQSFESALSRMDAVAEFPGNVKKNSKTGFQELINEAVAKYHEKKGALPSYLYDGLVIHVAGDLTFNGNGSTAYQPAFPITLVVDGDINLNGATLNSTRDFPIAIMSKNGNITVNGGGATYTGILYAPKGDITLNGNNANFLGMIVGQNIRKSGGKITVTYYDEADRFLPSTKVHLIA